LDASIPQLDFGSDCNDWSPPDFAPIFPCRSGNIGFFSRGWAKRRHHFSALRLRQLENRQMGAATTGYATGLNF
jgi:hypothetical protein